MQDVSGFGFVANVKASNTFPTGFALSAFADDADPFDIPEIKVSEFAMGLNGDLITWSKATPTEIKVAVIQGSTDDLNLSILFAANRVGKGKASAADVIGITALYADGSTNNFLNGRLTAGMPGPSVASSGRLKTKTYSFVFENAVRTEPVGT